MKNTKTAARWGTVLDNGRDLKCALAPRVSVLGLCKKHLAPSSKLQMIAKKTKPVQGSFLSQESLFATQSAFSQSTVKQTNKSKRENAVLLTDTVGSLPKIENTSVSRSTCVPSKQLFLALIPPPQIATLLIP